MSLLDISTKNAQMQTSPYIHTLPTYTELLQKGWDFTKADLALTAGLTLVYCLGLGALGYVDYWGYPISVFISAGYVACLIQMRAGKSFDFKDFFWAFQSFERLIHVLLTSILRSGIIIVGLCLLIVPGIYWSVTTSLADIVVVKEDTDCITALKRSMQLIKGRWGYMAGLLCVCMLLNLVGFMCFLVGVFVTIPLSFHILLSATEAFATGISPTSPTSTDASFIRVN